MSMNLRPWRSDIDSFTTLGRDYDRTMWILSTTYPDATIRSDEQQEGGEMANVKTLPQAASLAVQL